MVKYYFKLLCVSSFLFLISCGGDGESGTYLIDVNSLEFEEGTVSFMRQDGAVHTGNLSVDVFREKREELKQIIRDQFKNEDVPTEITLESENQISLSFQNGDVDNDMYLINDSDIIVPENTNGTNFLFEGKNIVMPFLIKVYPEDSLVFNQCGIFTQTVVEINGELRDGNFMVGDSLFAAVFTFDFIK